MPSVAVYNQEGKKVNDVSLSDAVFAVGKNDTVVHQVYVAQLANTRNAWAHAKDRSEVRGGGRKPWKQKGTGRARHGSSRSPIWSGGGVTFGPLKNRTFDKKVNKKTKQQAVRVSLSSKVQDDALLVLEALTTTGKTKDIASCYSALPCNGKKTLIVVDVVSEELGRAAKNLQRVDVQRASDLNVVDLLHHQCVVVTKEAVDVLEKRLA